MYDAAYLVYGRNYARLLMHKIDQAGMAYVGSFGCDGSRLHPTTKITEFRQYILFDENIQRHYQHFTKSCQWLRNLQDWSRCNANMTRKLSNDHKQGPRERLLRSCKGKSVYKNRKRKGGDAREQGHR